MENSSGPSPLPARPDKCGPPASPSSGRSRAVRNCVLTHRAHGAATTRAPLSFCEPFDVNEA